MKALLPRSSLILKVRGALLLTTLVALVVALAAMFAIELKAYRAGWIGDLEAQAALMARANADELSSGDRAGAQRNLAMLALQPKVQAAGLYDAAGELFSAWNSGASDAPQAPAMLAASGHGVVAGAGLIEVRRPVVKDGHRVGTLWLKARDEIPERLAHYVLVALAVAALALVAGWFVSSWLQKLITRPILDVAAIARDVVARGDYSRRAAKLSDDEVGGLVDAFNSMLAEIDARTRALQATNATLASEVEERGAAQQEVMRLNTRLEERVQERTHELEDSNRELSLASDAAQAASRAKTDFLSNMSHELRTPLNAIIGFGQLLDSDELATTRERQHEFAAHIVEAGRHLLDLINEILNLAQIEAGKLSMSLEPVRIADVLEECGTLTRGAAGQRRIRCVFAPAGDLHVLADRTRLKQVLLNLLSNAIKYNRPDGAVIVECRAGDEGWWRVSVQDTGAGLDAAQMRALFQPFGRLARDRETEGHGIGLALSKRLVEVMGGQIGVTSRPGEGSTFWIDLRAAPEPENTAFRHSDWGRLPESTPVAAAAAPPATILCVDDNVANLSLLREALALRADCRVLTATDGRAGLEVARHYQPDVILMDNNMPVMNGMDALRALRANPATAMIPVIAVTANAMPGAAAAAIEAGFFRYLVKPFDLVDLIDAVDEALDARARHGSA
ncbi:MAG TPA: ATP-binding protein [Burkholderiaceae bacterium]|nr:ATP-binding protein [Burkholderiaceae bacterium]